MGNLSILDEPLHIFNTDEIGFPMAPRLTKVLAGKGDQQESENFYSNFTLAMFGHSTNGWIDTRVIPEMAQRIFHPRSGKSPDTKAFSTHD